MSTPTCHLITSLHGNPQSRPVPYSIGVLQSAVPLTLASSLFRTQALSLHSFSFGAGSLSALAARRYLPPYTLLIQSSPISFVRTITRTKSCATEVPTIDIPSTGI